MEILNAIKRKKKKKETKGTWMAMFMARDTHDASSPSKIASTRPPNFFFPFSVPLFLLRQQPFSSFHPYDIESRFYDALARDDARGVNFYSRIWKKSERGVEYRRDECPLEQHEERPCQVMQVFMRG